MTMKRPDNVPLENESRRKRPKLDHDVLWNDFGEWDDDLNGDVLEEACVIAELTQSINTPSTAIRPESSDNELKRLRETLKTKEGEIVILRSQLKNHENNKRNESINNLKVMEQIKKHHQNEISLMKKETENLKNELEFKDFEVKGLIEKCKEFNVRSPKVQNADPSSLTDERKSLFILSQAISTTKTKVMKQDVPEEESFVFAKKKVVCETEGKIMSRMLAPDLFKPAKDPCLCPSKMISFTKNSDLEPTQKFKHKWSCFPKQESKFHLLYPIIINLCQSDVLPQECIIQIFKISSEILKSLKEVLTFLCGFPIDINHEKELLEDTDPGSKINLEQLLGNEPVKPLEYGVESRRVLAVLTCILKSTSSCRREFISHSLLPLMNEIVSLIGRLMRPVEFSGVLVGTLHFIRVVLEKNLINENSLRSIRAIIEGAIFSRPKLDVLQEVLWTLSAGVEFADISDQLCKRSLPDTSAIYMDSKFQQAVFFTLDACPIKILQIQVKTLAHLSKSPIALLNVTRAFSHWLQSIQSHVPKPPDWLVVTSDDHCCDILECYAHILGLCTTHAEVDGDFKNVLEVGIMTLRNCCKGHDRKLKNSTLKSFPATLRNSPVLGLLSSKSQVDALWLISHFENEMFDREMIPRTSNS